MPGNECWGLSRPTRRSNNKPKDGEGTLARGGLFMHSLVQRLQTHPGSRRGGGGVAWGGDACIALGGRALSPAKAMQASPINVKFSETSGARKA